MLTKLRSESLLLYRSTGLRANSIVGKMLNKISLYVFLLFYIADAFRRPFLNRSLYEIPPEIVERKLLGSVIKANSPNDHLISHLPGFGSTTFKQFAGHLPVDDSGQNFIFYWLFESEVNAETKPLIIWLNGGPGCSSMDGLFIEGGPLRITPGRPLTVSVNPFGWHAAGNIMFVDQPIGTGLSFSGNKNYASSDLMVNTHFYRFLQEFFKLHSSFVSVVNGVSTTRPIYLTGESHAGHYIPTMTSFIMNKNKGPLGVNAKIVIEGIALGNPWIDPVVQYDVSEFAHGQGIISTGQKNTLKNVRNRCQSSLLSGKYLDSACFNLLDEVVAASSYSGSKQVSMYDTRSYVQSQSAFPPGRQTIEDYLNINDVRAAIHASATPQKYVECADPPYFALQHQDGRGSTAELVEVLEGGVKVLVYAGQYDMICNHIGVETLLDRLKWSKQKDWLDANNFAYSLPNNKEVIGYVRSFKNLAYLKVLGSGHMVPMDQPYHSLDMIHRLITADTTTNDGFLHSYVDGLGKSKLSSTAVEPDGLLSCPTPVVSETKVVEVIRNVSGACADSVVQINNVNSSVRDMVYFVLGGVVLGILISRCWNLLRVIGVCRRKTDYKVLSTNLDEDDTSFFEEDV